MNPKVFEPHNGYGSRDPDGEPWPFGYVSEDYGRPIFELRPLFVAPYDDLHGVAVKMAASSALFDALTALLTVAEMTTFSDQYPAECEAARAVISAIAKATETL